MQEDFLHYLWQYKKFDILNIKTSNQESISILSVGQHNLNSGPDFFNSKLKIGDQLWAGNVEIHINSSDWYVHNHENDAAYDNVILHVVWEHDTDVFRKDNVVIPTLELKYFVEKKALANYHNLFSKPGTWVNCESDFINIDDFTIKNWLERLYFERLERKAFDINALLLESKNDWEAVLFKMLAKSFGSRVNGDAFLSIAKSANFSVVRKLQSKQMQLEALFFGQSNLLDKEVEEAYVKELLKEYTFLQQKFKLQKEGVSPIQFFRLRPPNFPTIRLSQLARLYCSEQNIFSKVIDTNTLSDFYNLFAVSTSAFWETHYTFNKVSKSRKKIVAKPFIDLLLINTIIPLKFSYAKYQGKQIDDSIIKLISELKSEKNNIVNKFNSLKKVSFSALDSQGLIQLKNEYCSKNKCLQCAIGSKLLNK
ncbi:DUF2851 family protein [Postechiella marina]|uniref:DUF2851 family protein n=1 Tax=Postechiella marina TaxID=943941 RepID=A0ABP8CHE3_9FLAO